MTGWRSWLRDVIAGCGLAAILVACLVYTDATAFPGLAAALPVLGTAAVIFAGSGRQDRPRRWRERVGAAPPRGGRLVVLVYLWHWPLLVIAPLALGKDLNTLQAVAMLGCTFVLAGATYRWVETPFRSGLSWRPPRALLLYPISLVLVLGSAGAGRIYTDQQVGEDGHDPAVTLTDFGVDRPGDYHLRKDPAAALVGLVIAAQHDMAVPSDLTPDLLDVENDVARRRVRVRPRSDDAVPTR